MALEDIRSTVLDRAQKQAAHVVQLAEKQAAELLESQKQREKEEAERRYQGATRTIEEDFARKLSQFNGAAAKQLLDKRNACLREVFVQARRKILSLPEPEYAALMRRLLEQAAGGAGGRVRVHPDDQPAFARIVSEANAGRAGDTRLALDEERGLAERGGFIFVTKNFEVDQTLATLLNDIEREQTPAIAAALFPA